MSGPGAAAVADPALLTRLAATIRSRRGAAPESSHTARLLAKGSAKAAEKFGEEAIEAVIEAARAGTPAFRPQALASEAADVIYHLLVMLEACDLSLDDALAALATREGTSGVAEKAARTQEIAIERALSPEHIARCLALRTEVFIAEQGVPAAEEQDGEDASCRHWIAHRGIETLGTLRVKAAAPGGGAGPGAKIQRVAIARRARGTGLGARLMRHVLAEIAGENTPVWLESQICAIAFYTRLGFVAEGPEFMDAGIAHRRMRLPQA